MKRSTIMILLVVLLPTAALISCRNTPSGLLGPGSVIFVDTDMGSDQLGGTVTIARAADESKITHYVIYWGSGEGEKLAGVDAIGQVEVSAAALTVEVPQNTVIPEGATHLLAYVKNGDAESEDCGSGLIEDLGSTVTITVDHSFTDVETFGLTVTGSDLTTITQSSDGSSSQIVVEVADGTDRTFEVLATMGATAPSAVLSIKGTVTTDLTAGEPASLTLALDELQETKIVIPDYYGDSRIVQIDDMSGAGWTEMQAADIGWSTDSYMLPYDIDFDGTGRIYVANFTSSGGRLGIFRINNISGDNPAEITNTVERAKCIAIDRLRNIIYYASAPEGEYLYKCNFDGSEHKQLIASEIFTFNGLAVDEEGMLYVAGDGDFGDVLYKYDPVTETIEETYGSGNENIGEAWDVLVKDESVYMANYNGFDEYQIMQFDKNLQLLDSFGINAAAHDRLASPLEKDFLGPHRFVAILNKKITIIDENGGSADTERLVSFEDMDGTGWDTFEPNGTTQSAFEFFEQY